MQVDPFVESDQPRCNGCSEVAPVFETVAEIGWRLPALAAAYGGRILKSVLIPDAPHPRDDVTIRQGREKLRGSERAAIVEHADQEFLGPFEARGNDLFPPERFWCRR